MNFRLTPWLLLACMPLSTLAQGPAPVLSEQDMARTKAQIKEQMDSLTDQRIEAERRKIIVPRQQAASDEDLKANRQPMPKLDALPVLQTRPNVDIGALSGQFLSQMKPVQPGDVTPTPKLLVFVTLALPAQSLKALVVQAEKAGATLVLRGFVNDSFRQTGAALRQLIGTHKLGFVVDPEAFDRYGVTHAPTFVLTKADAAPARGCADKSCAPSAGYVLISGDVSLDYALEKIEQRAPRFKNEARGFLKRMRG